MKKSLIVLAVLLAVLMAFVGCSKKDASTSSSKASSVTSSSKEETTKKSITVTSPDNPVTIEFWHYMSSNHGTCMEELTKEFNETIGKEKGINVVPVYQGSDTYSKIVGAIKAKHAPAVIQTSERYVLEYIDAGVAVDLTPYVFDDVVGMKGEDDWNDVNAIFREQASSYGVDGIWDFPFCKSTEVLYYNKDLFEANGIEVPTTWDELTEVARKLTAITGAASLGYDNTFNLFATLCSQFDNGFTDEDGNLLFVDKDGKPNAGILKALNMWYNNVNEGIWRLAGEDKFFSGPFASGKVPMYIGHTTESGYIKMKDPQFTWSAAPIPQADLSDRKVISSGNMLMALNDTGDERVSYAAYEYMKFMINKQSELAMTLCSGYLPSRYSTVELPEFVAYVNSGEDDGKKVGATQADYYFFEQSFVKDTYTSATLYDETKKLMSNILEAGVEPKKALDEMLARLR